MNQIQQGFTLIELMIVVAIIAILAAIALPTYRDFTTRAKLAEAIVAVGVPKDAISTAFHTGGALGVQSAANAWHTTRAGSPEIKTKYVSDIDINPVTPYEITVTLAGASSGLPLDAQNTTLKFTPNVQQATITATTTTGAMDWGCASTEHTTATQRGLRLVKGSLPSRYAPPECR
jgi:type IV pilus assembly protein PilA